MNGRGSGLTLVLGPPAPAETGCIMVRPETTTVTLPVRVEQAGHGLREFLSRRPGRGDLLTAQRIAVEAQRATGRRGAGVSPSASD